MRGGKAVWEGKRVGEEGMGWCASQLQLRDPPVSPLACLIDAATRLQTLKPLKRLYRNGVNTRHSRLRYGLLVYSLHQCQSEWYSAKVDLSHASLGLEMHSTMLETK